MKRLLLSMCLIFLLCFSGMQQLKADEAVQVTGSIAPHTTDFPLTITPNTTGTLSQNQTITYTITYGSNLYYADQITLEAYWSQGTISGNSTASIDGMDYVSGSASNAYGGTQPIVNLSSQKISWSISSFPAQTTNQTVTFQLQTNSSYTENSVVNFPIKVRLIATNYTKPYESISTNYQYDSSQAAPTPTPGSSSQSDSSPTSTPAPAQPTAQATTITPTPKPQSLSAPSSNAPVQNVSIVHLSDSSTQIAVNLNKVTSATVVYGLNPKSLANSSAIAIDGSEGIIDLSDLEADTTYYMQLITKDKNGTVVKSEVFAVQTAQTSAEPEVSRASLVIASDHDVLYSAGLNNQANNPSASLQKTPQIPVSQEGNYTFAFKLTKADKIKTVTMTLKNISVLGVSNFHPVNQPLQYSFPVLENGSGGYAVQIKNPSTPGTYDVFVKITDYDGNITTQKVAEIRVLKPFRVYNSVTKKPIEDARILIYKYNDDSKKFDLLPNFGGLANPIYTNSHGEATEQLPSGKYRVQVGRLGYIAQFPVFTIGATVHDDFPTVYLVPTAITPLNIFNYYRNAFTDYIGTTALYIAAIQQSYRYFDLLGLCVTLCFIIIGFLLFKIKSHIAFSHIPYYVHHHTLSLFGKKETPYLHAIVADKTTKQPISGARVVAIDELTHLVIGEASTTRNGSILLPFDKTKKYTLSVSKQGYEITQVGYAPGIVIGLIQAETVKKRVFQIGLEALQNGLALFFEFFLIMSLLLEIAFFPAFGLIRTLPGLLASIFNIVLWLFYLREKGKQFSVS